MNVQAIRPSKCRLAGLGMALAASLGVARAGAGSVIRAYVLSGEWSDAWSYDKKLSFTPGE